MAGDPDWKCDDCGGSMINVEADIQEVNGRYVATIRDEPYYIARGDSEDEAGEALLKLAAGMMRKLYGVTGWITMSGSTHYQVQRDGEPYFVCGRLMDGLPAPDEGAVRCRNCVSVRAKNGQ